MDHIYRWLGINMSRREDRNAWYLIIEVFWNGFLSAAMTFCSAYALRLGATNKEIGLLASLPSLITFLFSIPAGRFYQKRSTRFPWIIGTLVAYRLGLLLLVIIPWIVIGGVSKGLMVVIVITLVNIPQVICSIGFTPMMIDVTTEEQRPNVIAYRSIAANIAVVIGIAVYGVWLDRVKFPTNYQVMILFGAVIAHVSTYLLLQMDVPDSVPAAPKARTKNLLPHSFKEILNVPKSAVKSQPRFVQLVVLIFLHNVGLWTISPLPILYLVRLLKATDGQIAINSTIGTIFALIGYELFRRLIRRKGNPFIIKVLAPFYGLHYMIFSILPNLLLVYLTTAFINGLSPGYSLSQTNLLFNTLPEDKRPSYYALWTTIMTIGPFVFPNIGVLLADQFGIANIIRIGGFVVLVASALFWIWQPRENSPKTAQPVAQEE